LRKPNYHQQRKAREDARKVRQAKKQERRQAPATDPVDGAEAPGADRTPAAGIVPESR